ncbi:hypothetical protein OROMI_013444 [Orobanche minor]
MHQTLLLFIIAMVFKKMIKSAWSKSLIIRINLIFLSFFLLLYIILLLCPSASYYHERAALLVRCSLHQCHHKKENLIKMKSMLEEPSKLNSPPEVTKREKPSFLKGIIGKEAEIGTVNMDDEDVSDWNARIISISFDKVSHMFEWKDIFPEWIDEEEEYSGSSCPEIPMPDSNKYGDEYMDVIVSKLPCSSPEEGWNRDVFRFQVHLVAAKMAAKRGRKDWSGRVKVVFLSECVPMPEIFRCDEMVEREGHWWYYRVEVGRLEQKVGMPLGSCSLALPLWGKEMPISLVAFLLSSPTFQMSAARLIKETLKGKDLYNSDHIHRNSSRCPHQ